MKKWIGILLALSLVLAFYMPAYTQHVSIASLRNNDTNDSRRGIELAF